LKKTLGNHFLLEFHGCPYSTLANVSYVEEHLLNAAKVSNSHIIRTLFHQFQPYGVSGIVVITESHISIHTWPEYNYAAIDLFFCSDDVFPERAIEYLKEAFNPENVEIKQFKRGEVLKTGVSI